MNKPLENPVGDEGPTVRFPYKTWQVLVGLFVVAILVTAWQWYARNYIAPATPIRWNDFSVDETIEVERQRRNLLVWIQPEDQAAIDETQKLLCTPAVQAAAWASRPAARIIPAGQLADAEVNDWITQMDARLPAGGFVMLEAGDDPRFVLQADVTEQSLVNLISGPQ